MPTPVTATSGGTANVSVTMSTGHTGAGIITLRPPTPTGPPPAPVPVPVPKIEVGVDVAPAEYGYWYPQFPQAKFGRVYSPEGSGLPNLKGPAVAKLGRTPWISFKDPVAIADVIALWTAARALVPKGTRIRCTFRHEGENYPIDVHRSYYRTLRAARDDHGFGDLITLTDIRTLYACRFKSGVDWREWMLPGVVDEVSWDCYAPTEWPTYEPVESLFGLPIASSREFDMPLSIAEFGAVRRNDPDGTRRGAWLGAGVDYLAANGCRAVGLWCSKETDKSGNVLDYRPTTPAELQQWKTIVSKYA